MCPQHQTWRACLLIQTATQPSAQQAPRKGKVLRRKLATTQGLNDQRICCPSSKKWRADRTLAHSLSRLVRRKNVAWHQFRRTTSPQSIQMAKNCMATNYHSLKPTSPSTWRDVGLSAVQKAKDCGDHAGDSPGGRCGKSLGARGAIRCNSAESRQRSSRCAAARHPRIKGSGRNWSTGRRHGHVSLNSQYSDLSGTPLHSYAWQLASCDLGRDCSANGALMRQM